MRRWLVALAMVLVLMVLPTTTFAASPSPFFNGFETDTSGWFDNAPGSIVRQPSGYTNGGGYADGIASATGGYHARLVNTQSGGCVPPFSQSTSCTGPFTRWGGYTDTFPAGGYTTSVDVYLDVAWAATHPDYRFDWDVASNDNTGNFLRDFAFNAGTTPSGYAGTPGFVIGASTNAFRSSTYPSNPCPSPSTAPNVCRAPVYISTSGWYTFVHHFVDGGANGLQVDMSILDSSGTPVVSWTVYSGDPMTTVGGNRYGWFANQEINDLPIDNSQLILPDTQGPVTTNILATPNPAAVGTSATVTATVDDSSTGNSNIASAEYSLNGGAWTAMTAQDGSFDSPTENVTANITSPSSAGIYDLCVRGTDAPGNVGAPDCTMFVVYDPSAGFVTGGGWINSPAGAALRHPEGTVIVFPSNMQGWAFFDDNGKGGTGQMVSGPGTPPLGTGSAELAVTDSSQGYALGTGAYDGTKLSAITSLGYSSYQPGPTLAIALQLGIHYTSDATGWQGRLVFEPYQNGHVTVGSGWQTWSPLDGIWWATGGPGSTLCPQSNPCTWSQVLANWPDASINGAVVFKAGSGWSSFDGNVDAFTIGVNGANTTYDFEANGGPAGKATFGFVAKYQKGAITPDGNTEFVFKDGGIDFHSTSYDWLVVNQDGTNAQFKGEGSLNGVNGYNFMIWATDGASTNTADTFRIKITDASGSVVYDNGSNQAIGGGNIVVHTGK